MRGMRERAPQPHLTGGTAPDELFDAAPCRQPGAAPRWDLELDSNGSWQRAETKAQRKDRHETAKAECRECPALALCLVLPTEGRQGVIAGRVIR